MLLALLVALVALLVMLAVLLWWWAGERDRKLARLQQRAVQSASRGQGMPEDEALDSPRTLLAGLAVGGRKVEAWMDTGSETSRLLIQAGWRSEQKRMGFYALQAALPLVVVVLVLVSLLAGGFGSADVSELVEAGIEDVQAGGGRTLQGVLIGVMLVILATLAPRVLLRWRAADRRDRIRHEVPMFIHMLILLFEAGLSTRQAVASLIRQGGGVIPELQQEMLYALRQMDAGSDTAQAFQQLADAMNVAELDSVLGVLRQIERYGGEVREPLSEALQTIEEREVFGMREQVNKLSARMTVVMVLFFLPALLIFVAGPAFVSVLRALS